MRNIKLLIEYVGTNYCGWQRQKNGVSIQEKLEEAAFKVVGHKVTMQGSGRTDAGVHALGQVANFLTSTKLPNYKIVGGMNNYLPSNIAVLSAEDVAEIFNAQFDAKGKTYKYGCYLSKIARPTQNGLYAQINYDVDNEKMKQAAKFLIGEKDFVSFAGSKNEKQNTVRKITELDVCGNAEKLVFTITANGFLYNMVRIIVGTLLDVGNGKLQPEDVKRILEGKDRKLAGKTAPACGLYLAGVEY